MTAEYLLVVTALCRRAGTSAGSAARCSYQKDNANGRWIGRSAAMFCLGSARASRANVGALADIDFVQKRTGRSWRTRDGFANARDRRAPQSNKSASFGFWHSFVIRHLSFGIPLRPLVPLTRHVLFQA